MALMRRRKKKELDTAAAGMLLLFWQQPTDRALTGWQPMTEYYSREVVVEYLKQEPPEVDMPGLRR